LPEGGHYLVDLIAGGVVVIATILIVKSCGNRETKVTHLKTEVTAD
jgi:hypothetical protein